MTRQEIIAVMARAILDRSTGAMDKQACRADAAAALSAIEGADHVVVPVALLSKARDGLEAFVPHSYRETIARIDAMLSERERQP